MHHYTVWVDAAGITVGLPLTTYDQLTPLLLEDVGKAIAAGAGLTYLYTTEGRY